MPKSKKPNRKKRAEFVSYRGLWIQRIHDQVFIKKEKSSTRVFQAGKLFSVRQAKKFIAKNMRPV